MIMNRLKSIFNILLLLGCLMAVSGCQDEGLAYLDGSSASGEAIVRLEASFSPFAEGDLTRASNTAPARGFNSISDIVILAFSKENSEGKWLLYEICEPKGYRVTDERRKDHNASNGATAESDTKSVSGISFKLPLGTYYLMAVANFGEYKSSESSITVEKSSLEVLKAMPNFKIGEFSIEDLSRLRVNWDDDYANNRAMLGYFDSPNAPAPHSQGTYGTVTIDRSNIELRAWLRRCASKVTVDFDGSKLSDNVSIYIKDVRIYDIAADCSLGFGNPVSNSEGEVDYNNHPSKDDDLFHNNMIRSDESERKESFIEYGEGDFNRWPCITSKTPYITDESGNKKDMHTQASECLYFYENMQGTKVGYDRTPVPNLTDGGIAEGYNEKDGMPYGTYIEVTAHHVTESNGNSYEHDIKYRFMLGKNATDNFDAERNYHYKLTLAFLGNADEYHWHIDYTKDPPGFRVPNPWYVSYVYNHDAYLPFDLILPSADWEVVNMDAEIKTNPWYPTTRSNVSNIDEVEGDDFELRDPNYVISPMVPEGDDDYPYTDSSNVVNKGNWNGFLSLRAPSDESVLTDTRVGQPFTGYNASLEEINKDYYNGTAAGTDLEGNPVTPINHGYRELIKNTQPVVENITDRENLYVKRLDDVYNIKIPLFTREKVLIKQTGYTGNNPFVGYQRVGKVKLTATVRNKKDPNEPDRNYEAYVNVVQVRRVVNPKGVYRKSGNYEPFDVSLMFLTSERSDGEYKPIFSRGPWMAEVLGDDNFITLDGKQHVEGPRGPINFTIRFNRMGGSGNKNAIVRIKYHNYTCTHLIFVRQGYAPQAICAEGPIYSGTQNVAMYAPPTMWNTFNMVAGNVMADDPRDEGSLFRFGNPDEAISSIDNIYKDEKGELIFYEQTRSGFTPPDELTVLNPDGFPVGAKSWSSITPNKDPSGFANASNSNGTVMEISKAATMRDFEQLYLTKHIEFGYGVLYADGATVTQTRPYMVNGWYRDDPSAEKNQKGMRGVFAYTWNPTDPSDGYNTKNIFFPIGRSGYGHRKNAKENFGGINNDGMGILRYACSRSLPAKDCNTPAFQKSAPLFEFLYRRMGAIYWARTTDSGYLGWNGISEGGTAYGLDLNYFTFDVNSITNSNVDNGNDACFVRTVYRSAGD